MTRIRFISSNKFKIEETKKILNNFDIEVIPIDLKIHEIQTDDIKKLIRDKVIKAFSHVRRSLFVEHTGLHLEYLNDLPGGLTQLFWDKLEADKFSEIFGNVLKNRVIAKTIIGYCDSRKLFSFQGSISGKISPKPKGDRDFQWDCVFIPDGYDLTFAEMGNKKGEISMRLKALENFANFLREKNG